RYGQHFLCIVLANHILIEVFLNFNGTNEFQCSLQCLAFTKMHFFGQNFTRLRDASVADVRTFAGNEHHCVLFACAAERTSHFPDVFCHIIFVFWNSKPRRPCRVPWLPMRSSNNPGLKTFLPSHKASLNGGI